MQVDAFLAATATKAPGVYLEAAIWKLATLTTSYKAACRNAQRSGGTGTCLTLCSGSGGDGAAPDSSSSLAAGASGGASTVESLAVHIWDAAADMLQRKLLAPGGGADEAARVEAAKACQRALQLLGLEDSAAHVAAVAGAAGSSGSSGGAADGKEAKKEKKDKKEKKKPAAAADATAAAAGAGPDGQAAAGNGASEAAAVAPAAGSADARFQLRYCGHLLPREAPAERDRRVESFNPDYWQRKVGVARGFGHGNLVCWQVGRGGSGAAGSISAITQ
jgi:hypothetical protein